MVVARYVGAGLITGVVVAFVAELLRPRHPRRPAEMVSLPEADG
jgi:uncharacterized protein YoaH (UPF0181 family)